MYAGKNPIVFTDIDKTQRWGKDDIQRENKRAIRKFQKKGGLLMPITGAPLWHIPRILQHGIMFGESGGVLQLPDKRIVELVPEAGREAMWKLPVGFKNSIPEIQDIVRKRGGILIGDKDGPDGGAAKALSMIAASH